MDITIIRELGVTLVTSLITLFPIVNPIGNGFLINSFLHGVPETERKKLIKKIVTYCIFIGLGTLLLGRLVLFLFGLHISVIQLAGGIVICKTGLELLAAPNEESEKSEKDEQEEATANITLSKIRKQLFYPITFPIIMGAGSISVILTMMANATMQNSSLLHTLISSAIIAIAIIGICLLLYITANQTRLIVKRLGPSGHIIINKLIAFITFCIGLQILLQAISALFSIKIF